MEFEFPERLWLMAVPAALVAKKAASASRPLLCETLGPMSPPFSRLMLPTTVIVPGCRWATFEAARCSAATSRSVP